MMKATDIAASPRPRTAQAQRRSLSPAAAVQQQRPVTNMNSSMLSASSPRNSSARRRRPTRLSITTEPPATRHILAPLMDTSGKHIRPHTAVNHDRGQDIRDFYSAQQSLVHRLSAIADRTVETLGEGVVHEDLEAVLSFASEHPMNSSKDGSGGIASRTLELEGGNTHEAVSVKDLEEEVLAAHMNVEQRAHAVVAVLLCGVPEYNDILSTYEYAHFLGDPLDSIDKSTGFLRATVCNAYSTLRMIMVGAASEGRIDFVLFSQYRSLLRELRSFLALTFSVDDNVMRLRQLLDKYEYRLAHLSWVEMDLSNKNELLIRQMDVISQAFQSGDLSMLLRVHQLVHSASAMNDGKPQDPNDVKSLAAEAAELNVTSEVYKIISTQAAQRGLAAAARQGGDTEAFVVFVQVEDTLPLRTRSPETVTNCLNDIRAFLTALGEKYEMIRVNYSQAVELRRAYPTDGFVFIGQTYENAFAFALECQRAIMSSVDWPKALLAVPAYRPVHVERDVERSVGAKALKMLWCGLRVRCSLHCGRLIPDQIGNQQPTEGVPRYKGTVMEQGAKALLEARAGEVVVTAQAYEPYHNAQQSASIPIVPQYFVLLDTHVIERRPEGDLQGRRTSQHILRVMWCRDLQARASDSSYQDVPFGLVEFHRSESSMRFLHGVDMDDDAVDLEGNEADVPPDAVSEVSIDEATALLIAREKRYGLRIARRAGRRRAEAMSTQLMSMFDTDADKLSPPLLLSIPSPSNSNTLAPLSPSASTATPLSSSTMKVKAAGNKMKKTPKAAKPALLTDVTVENWSYWPAPTPVSTPRRKSLAVVVDTPEKGSSSSATDRKESLAVAEVVAPAPEPKVVIQYIERPKPATNQIGVQVEPDKPAPTMMVTSAASMGGGGSSKNLKGSATTPTSQKKATSASTKMTAGAKSKHGSKKKGLVAASGAPEEDGEHADPLKSDSGQVGGVDAVAVEPEESVATTPTNDDRPHVGNDDATTPSIEEEQRGESEASDAVGKAPQQTIAEPRPARVETATVETQTEYVFAAFSTTPRPSEASLAVPAADAVSNPSPTDTALASRRASSLHDAVATIVETISDDPSRVVFLEGAVRSVSHAVGALHGALQSLGEMLLGGEQSSTEPTERDACALFFTAMGDADPPHSPRSELERLSSLPSRKESDEKDNVTANLSERARGDVAQCFLAVVNMLFNAQNIHAGTAPPGSSSHEASSKSSTRVSSAAGARSTLFSPGKIRAGLRNPPAQTRGAGVHTTPQQLAMEERMKALKEKWAARKEQQQQQLLEQRQREAQQRAQEMQELDGVIEEPPPPEITNDSFLTSEVYEEAMGIMRRMSSPRGSPHIVGMRRSSFVPPPDNSHMLPASNASFSSQPHLSPTTSAAVLTPPKSPLLSPTTAPALSRNQRQHHGRGASASSRVSSRANQQQQQHGPVGASNVPQQRGISRSPSARPRTTGGGVAAAAAARRSQAQQRMLMMPR
eukprot:PhM_4_TR4517/c0_g1_i1/m.58666